MNKNGRLKDFRITQNTAINKADLSTKDIDEAFNDASHNQHRAIQFFAQLSDQLCEHRQITDPAIDLPTKQVHILNQDVQVQKTENTLADRIIKELCLLAGVAIGRWCDKRNIPAIYETRDPIENPESFAQRPHPVVRCHEMDRQKPCIDFITNPDIHHGHGISHYCPIIQPTTRYTDLIMQRQIAHYLKEEQPLYTVDELDTFRYRMWETHGLIDGLVYRHTRDLILQSWESQIGHKFRAVVLHLKIHGVFVELLDYPFKTVIYPGHALQVGNEINLRLTGIDRWKGWAHVTALSSEPQLRP
jgi:exoribonuclease R